MTSNAANRQTIADHYRRMILSGQLADGAPLPAVLDIAREHGVSKDVVTRAFRILQSDGLIRVLRKGALVSVGDLTIPDRKTWPNPGTRQLPSYDHVQILSAELVPAPDRVADDLGIEPLSPLVRRTQICLQGHLPVLYTISWCRAELIKTAPELISRKPVDTDELIRIAIGTRVTRGFDEVCARGANFEIARDLRIGEGAPMLAGHARCLTDSGEVVTVMEYCVPADRRMAFAYDRASD